jgi:uncharacterized protein (DUF1501 family)
VLVALFQRFGMDGLMAVCPYGDAKLASLRPNLMLSAPRRSCPSRISVRSPTPAASRRDGDVFPGWQGDRVPLARVRRGRELS